MLALEAVSKGPAHLAVPVLSAFWSTANDGVGHGHQSGLASADGVSITVDFASGSRSAGARVTRVWPLNAFLALADVSLVTVVVNDTLGSASSDCVRLGNQTLLAFADGIVIGTHPARGARPAGSRIAGISLLHALLVLADIATVTVVINDTLRSTSRDGVGLGHVSGLAVADRVSSPVDFASGSGTAGAGNAGIGLFDALLVSTDVSAVAVIVGLALWPAAGDGVWLGDQTSKAVADGVAGPVDCAGSARAAWSWKAGIGLLRTPAGINSEFQI